MSNFLKLKEPLKNNRAGASISGTRTSQPIDAVRVHKLEEANKNRSDRDARHVSGFWSLIWDESFRKRQRGREELCLSRQRALISEGCYWSHRFPSIMVALIEKDETENEC